MRYKCVCCDCFTLPEESTGTYNICPVCFWEDDIVQLNDPNFAGGANYVSLNEARKNYQLFKASEKRFIEKVRKPFEDELP